VCQCSGLLCSANTQSSSVEGFVHCRSVWHIHSGPMFRALPQCIHTNPVVFRVLCTAAVYVHCMHRLYRWSQCEGCHKLCLVARWAVWQDAGCCSNPRGVWFTRAPHGVHHATHASPSDYDSHYHGVFQLSTCLLQYDESSGIRGSSCGKACASLPNNDCWAGGTEAGRQSRKFVRKLLVVGTGGYAFASERAPSPLHYLQCSSASRISPSTETLTDRWLSVAA
jgi:hypothetical protein